MRVQSNQSCSDLNICFNRSSINENKQLIIKSIEEEDDKSLLNSQLFENIQLTSINGEEIPMSDLWKERTTIVKILPRLGCCLCKKEAQLLSELQPIFEKYNIGMAAIVSEDMDLWTFLSSGYWSWDLYLDRDKKVFQAAGLTRVSLTTFLKTFFSKNVFQLCMELISKGFSNNNNGDMRQLGGTFLIDTNGKILYEFRPNKAARFPDLIELYTLIGGDPSEVKQDIHPDFLYTRERLNNSKCKSIKSSIHSEQFN